MVYLSFFITLCLLTFDSPNGRAHIWRMFKCYSFVLLHYYSTDFWGVLNALPKLHTNDRVGRTSSPSKIALVLTSMVKSYF